MCDCLAANATSLQRLVQVRPRMLEGAGLMPPHGPGDDGIRKVARESGARESTQDQLMPDGILKKHR